MIKNNIRNLRNRLGISSMELAGRCSTDSSMILRLENGERGLTLEWMSVLSKGPGCQPWELLPIEWQPTNQDISGDERLLSIFTDIDSYLKTTRKTMPEPDKRRMALVFYHAGFNKSDDSERNQEEIFRALKLKLVNE